MPFFVLNLSFILGFVSINFLLDIFSQMSKVIVYV
jgi:hypothetical protein